MRARKPLILKGLWVLFFAFWYYFGTTDPKNMSNSKEAVQHEIRTDKRVGTVDTMEANIEAMERDLAEIMRWKGEQKRLWQEYEEWKRR